MMNIQSNLIASNGGGANTQGDVCASWGTFLHQPNLCGYAAPSRASKRLRNCVIDLLATAQEQAELDAKTLPSMAQREAAQMLSELHRQLLYSRVA